MTTTKTTLEADIPPWMTFLAESLESHLKTFETPILEILPHPTADRGCCGKHEAFKTHLQHFCLFLCCAKEISRYSLLHLASCGADSSDADVSNDGETRWEENTSQRDIGDGGDHHLAALASSSLPLSLARERLSRLSLLAQPEDYRSWNLLKHPRLDVTREIKFAYFVLSRHPRSAETYCHLRHVTRRASHGTASSVVSLCQRGFAECAAAASRYHGNYHAWDHRRFLASLLVDAGVEDVEDALQRELDEVKAWQSSRVSDACPFKYRLFLVETRSRGGVEGVKFDFLEELTELDRLMRAFPGHETLWNHRRDLIQLARQEEPTLGDLLLQRDEEFLASLNCQAKNDWELTLYDRYAKFSESMKG